MRIMHDICVLLRLPSRAIATTKSLRHVLSLALCVASQREKLDTGIFTHTMLKTWADLGTDFPSIEFSFVVGAVCVSQENENGIFLFSTPSSSIRANITYIMYSFLCFRIDFPQTAAPSTLPSNCRWSVAECRQMKRLCWRQRRDFSLVSAPPRRINRMNERADIFCHFQRFFFILDASTNIYSSFNSLEGFKI